MTEINNNIYLKSDLSTIGVDEVGRGTLFGNVVAAAVIMPDNLNDELFNQIKDSKKLSFKNNGSDVLPDISVLVDVGSLSVLNTNLSLSVIVTSYVGLSK
jgi:ribonuclease HII